MMKGQIKGERNMLVLSRQIPFYPFLFEWNEMGIVFVFVFVRRMLIITNVFEAFFSAKH